LRRRAAMPVFDPSRTCGTNVAGAGAFVKTELTGVAAEV
jgi:hypothetical protein